METLQTICMWTGVVWWSCAFIAAAAICGAMLRRDDYGEVKGHKATQSFGWPDRVEPWE